MFIEPVPEPDGVEDIEPDSVEEPVPFEVVLLLEFIVFAQSERENIPTTVKTKNFFMRYSF